MGLITLELSFALDKDQNDVKKEIETLFADVLQKKEEESAGGEDK
jgi:CarD family transcriptional regulator